MKKCKHYLYKVKLGYSDLEIILKKNKKSVDNIIYNMTYPFQPR